MCKTEDEKLQILETKLIPRKSLTIIDEAPFRLLYIDLWNGITKF